MVIDLRKVRSLMLVPATFCWCSSFVWICHSPKWSSFMWDITIIYALLYSFFNHYIAKIKYLPISPKHFCIASLAIEQFILASPTLLYRYISSSPTRNLGWCTYVGWSGIAGYHCPGLCLGVPSGYGARGEYGINHSINEVGEHMNVVYHKLWGRANRFREF